MANPLLHVGWGRGGGNVVKNLSGKFENLCLEVHFDDRKVIWLEATVCTLFLTRVY